MNTQLSMPVRNLESRIDLASIRGRSGFNAGAENGKEFGKPYRMRGPCWGGDEVTVNDGLVHRKIDVGASGSCNVRCTSRIRAALSSLKDARSREDLRAMADGGDRLFRGGEVTDDF